MDNSKSSQWSHNTSTLSMAAVLLRYAVASGPVWGVQRYAPASVAVLVTRHHRRDRPARRGTHTAAPAAVDPQPLGQCATRPLCRPSRLHARTWHAGAGATRPAPRDAPRGAWVSARRDPPAEAGRGPRGR